MNLSPRSAPRMRFIYSILWIYLRAPVLGFLAQHGGRTYLILLLGVKG